MNATAKRHQAMKTITERCFASDGRMLVTFDERFSVVADIQALVNYGRTARWHASVQRWANMVYSSTDADDMRFNILQGSIYALHAS